MEGMQIGATRQPCKSDWEDEKHRKEEENEERKEHCKKEKEEERNLQQTGVDVGHAEASISSLNAQKEETGRSEQSRRGQTPTHGGNNGYRCWRY